MIGINFSYPDEVDKLRSPPWLELRASRIEPGPPNVVWSRGDTHEVQYYWRNWNIPLEERTRLMEDVVKGLVKSHKVDGFTLWWNWSSKKWQMNVRYAEERGWTISYISQAEAEAIFSTLQASHPDGPWKVRPDYVQDDERAKAEVEKEQKLLTPVERQDRATEDLFDSKLERTETWPYAKRRELPLADALRRAAEAVERGNAVLAAIVGVEP